MISAQAQATLARMRSSLEENGSHGHIPPRWLLDRIADRKLTGGYNVARSNQCPVCYQVKSSNGACNCTS